MVLRILETRPPSAPDAAPAEEESALVETVIPVAPPAVGAPMVMPPRVTVIAPGDIVLTPTVRTMELALVAPLLVILLGPMMTGMMPGAKKPVG